MNHEGQGGFRLFGAFGQALPGFGRHQPGAVAQEQGGADRILQPQQMARHRRLVDAEHLRGARLRAVACHGEQDAGIVPRQFMHILINNTSECWLRDRACASRQKIFSSNVHERERPVNQ
jgi:hypothetical protein